MSRKTEFIPHPVKRILNKHKHADHWFWTRYSAHPYIGCQHGCEFCYSRESKYCPHEHVDDFSYQIKIKENAPELFRRELARVPVGVVFTGDYQPAERKFNLSRRMLEVCLELGFPVFILERSPLVLRDLDLIKLINEKSAAVVAFSIIATPESGYYRQVKQMEHLAPAMEERFEAMRSIAAAGIPTGTSFMPILPGLCDDDANLEAVVRMTADAGGRFVLAGGLTLSDQQRAYYLDALQRLAPELLPLYQKLFPPGSYSAIGNGWRETGLKVRSYCQKYGILDRIPRPVIPGDKHSLNHQIAETLANNSYSLELSAAPGHRVWAYRKAAWALDELEQDIGLIYRQLGHKGLVSIEGIGEHMAGEIEKFIPANMKPSVD
jgi:DNA repair photolyase